MESTTLDTTAQRLNRLERENQRLKRLGAMAVVMLAAIALMGQAQPKVAKRVEAEEFVLRDARGAVHARFTMATAGGPALFLFHKSVTQPENPPHALDLQVIDDDPAMGRLGPGLTHLGLEQRDALAAVRAALSELRTVVQPDDWPRG